MEMSEGAKAARRAYNRDYMRRWRAANRERDAENAARYWERKAQKARENHAEATTAE